MYNQKNDIFVKICKLKYFQEVLRNSKMKFTQSSMVKEVFKSEDTSNSSEQRFFLENKFPTFLKKPPFVILRRESFQVPNE